MRPAVHHLPFGQTDETVRWMVACWGADDAVTVTVVPRAAPSEEPKAASETLCIAVSRSATGAETGVPSGRVAEVAMVMVRVRPLLVLWSARP